MSSRLQGANARWNEFQPWNHQIVSEFNNQLKGLGTSSSAISTRTTTAQHFVFWLETNGLNIVAVDCRIANQFLNHHCKCPSPYEYSKYSATYRGYLLSVFLRFLADTGRMSMPSEIETGIQLLDQFTHNLIAQGYSLSKVNNYRGRCRHFIVWLYLSGIPITAVERNVQDCFLNHDCTCSRTIFFRKPGGGFNTTAYGGYQIRRFVSFLASEGIVANHAPTPHCEEPHQHLTAFLDWLVQHRGVSEQTLNQYRRYFPTLFADLGNDPGRYDVALIRSTLLHRLESGSRGLVQCQASMLRMYLRYLASAGLCPTGLVYAVPDNRLVASALESEWNDRLRGLREADEQYKQMRSKQVKLNPCQHNTVMELAVNFRKLWGDQKTPMRERKRMLRLLVHDVTLVRNDDISVAVRFKGGTTHQFQLPMTKSYAQMRKTSPQVLKEMDRLLNDHIESEVAEQLNAKGLCSGDGKKFHTKMIRRLCNDYGLQSRKQRLVEAGLLTAGQIAVMYDVSVVTVRRWRKAGSLKRYPYNDRNEFVYEKPNSAAVSCEDHPDLKPLNK